MEEMKDKMKGLMKKVNNPFSSKFQGQGRVLGSDPSPSPSRNPPPSPAALSSSRSVPKPRLPPADPEPEMDRKPSPSFGRSSAPATIACPVCNLPFSSEADVAVHLDSCLSDSAVTACVSSFIAGNPGKESVEIVLKLLRNVAREPENDKFRRIRMGNPKIKQAVGDVKGGVDLLECVGFRIVEDGGEVWAIMEVPDEERIRVVKDAVASLERLSLDEPSSAAIAAPKAFGSSVEQEQIEQIDRQVRVFFSVPESVAAKIELPDSFYNLSADEIKRESSLRKKKLADSQLLIPKSYREKQALVAKKKYTKTLIRIQFPDGVVLQALFLPRETTTELYKFVSAALKEPSLEFELLHPTPPKRVIPHFARPGEKLPTLEDADLVPKALIRFKPFETESMVFTGLSNALLQISEPLITASAV